MNPTTIPIHEIKVEDRQRTDMGEITELAESIRRFGLIQPIVITQDKRLVAGGRRLAASLSLGLSTIAVVYRENLTQDELHELELEENVRRKEMTWVEKCRCIHTIHKLRVKRNALEGKGWGQRETSELFGLNVRDINYSLRLAQLIEAGDQEIAQAESPKAAWDIIMLRDKQKALAELARRSQLEARSNSLALAPTMPLEAFLLPGNDSLAGDQSNAPISQAAQSLIDRVKSDGYLSLSRDEAQELYLLNPHNDPNLFEIYHTQRTKAIQDKDRTIAITHRLHHGDGIAFMLQPSNVERFDKIITDPPYGIEMDNLAQTNTGVVDITTVEAEHTVEGNESLLRTFFPAAYHCLKEHSHLLLCCDIMQWQYLYNLATEAGFKVQRWPVVWVKTHPCINQMASQNFTKTIELVMVCRKGCPTLAVLQHQCHILASNDDFKSRHPFAKPFDLWAFLMQAVAFQSETILDPFAGSGSSIISGLRLGYNMYACEVNPNHYNQLLESVKQYYLEMNPDYLFI